MKLPETNDKFNLENKRKNLFSSVQEKKIDLK
jgi:hypothetical protein